MTVAAPKKRRSAATVGAHQLDEISLAIGRIDAYVHEFRHGTNNLEQLVKASDHAAEKRHTTLKVELKAELKESADTLRRDMAHGMEALREDLAGIDGRVQKLEENRHQQEGALRVWQWLINHSPLAMIASALAAFIAWANGKI